MAVCTTSADGTKKWHLNGEKALLHREDGPAVEHADGTKKWFLHHEPHREDGPAIEYNDGAKFWYLYGKLHREDGPAIEHADRSRCWYIRGERHRLDGPAVIEYTNANGTSNYYYRLDGPVIELVDKTKHWYFEGHALTEEQHARIRSRIERAEKTRARRIKWFILDRLLPRLCSPKSAAFLKRFHADWDAASL